VLRDRYELAHGNTNRFGDQDAHIPERLSRCVRVAGHGSRARSADLSPDLAESARPSVWYANDCSVRDREGDGVQQQWVLRLHGRVEFDHLVLNLSLTFG
jgi:hypothetical protein